MSDQNKKVKKQYPKVITRLHYFHQTGRLADCKLIVGGDPQESRTFRVHKLILAMASPVFKTMFYGIMADKKGTVTISDIHPDDCQAMLL